VKARRPLAERNLHGGRHLTQQSSNLLGAVVAILIYVLTILVFSARLAGDSRAEHWIGLAVVATGVPIIYLLVTAGGRSRPPLYFVQLSLMLLYLVIELLLDYVMKVDFRGVRWMTVAYVTLFFAGTGGMIGVASHAGKPWTVSAVVLFLLMAALAFIQRAKTGM
jgi:hypothetical protein